MARDLPIHRLCPMGYKCSAGRLEHLSFLTSRGQKQQR